MKKRDIEKVKSRASFVKEIAKKLNAEYQYGLNKVKFPFDIKENRYNPNSNVITGKFDGYEYCFVESFHDRCSDDTFRWESILYIRLKDNIPDLSLLTKEKAKSEFITKLIFTLAFLVLPAILLIGFLSNLGKDFHLIIPALILVVPVVIGLLGIKDTVKYKRQIDNQGIYTIRNTKFKEKYVIISKEAPNTINRIFNEKVCSEIADYPSPINFEIKNNCTHLGFENSEKLSYDLCKKYLDQLLKQVKIFEKADLV